MKGCGVGRGRCVCPDADGGFQNGEQEGLGKE